IARVCVRWDSLVAGHEQARCTGELAARNGQSIRLATGGVADLVIEAYVRELAEVELVADLEGAGHLVAKGRASDLVTARDVDGADILIRPRNEDHPAQDGGSTKCLVGLDLTLHHAIATNDEQGRPLAARHRDRGQVAV